MKYIIGAVYTIMFYLVAGTSLAVAHPFDHASMIVSSPSLYEIATPRKPAYTKTKRNKRYLKRASVSSYEVAAASGRARGHNGRPARWCGWWMRQQRGGGPEYNLAWNWRNYGSPSGPQIGAVVVWRHHVGQIVGQSSNGQWLVQSGNDGGAVRTRARSVKGAIFRI